MCAKSPTVTKNLLMCGSKILLVEVLISVKMDSLSAVTSPARCLRKNPPIEQPNF
jgi:hypothetical protein